MIKKTQIKIIIFALLYIPVFIFFVFANIKNFFILDISLIPKALLIIIPLYFYLINKFNIIFNFARILSLILPFAYLILLSELYGGKSATNFFLLNIPSLIILWGINFIPFALGMKDSRRNQIIILLLILVIFTISFILQPTFND